MLLTWCQGREFPPAVFKPTTPLGPPLGLSSNRVAEGRSRQSFQQKALGDPYPDLPCSLFHFYEFEAID
jgi:hypothetical protein